MTDKLRQAAQQMLEAVADLTILTPREWQAVHGLKINALRDELAEQPAEQEPAAWLHPANPSCVTTDSTAYARGIPLYTAPPDDTTLLRQALEALNHVNVQDRVQIIAALRERLGETK